MNVEKQFADILHLITNAKRRAILAINSELINLYWEIGKYISVRISNAEWGKGVVKNLSEFIQKQEPGINGFSVQNIWRMKQFYETYVENEKLSTLLRELTWTNNLFILSKSQYE